MTMSTHVLIVSLLVCLCYHSVASLAPWDLPLVPSAEEAARLSEEFYRTQPRTHSHWDAHYHRRIPRNVWIAFKEKPSASNVSSWKAHHQAMHAKNHPRWTFQMQGNEEKLAFMRKYFANTSTLWAYEAIHPRVGNSAADLWRYAVLWMFGGVYLDDDSTIAAGFDEVFNANETFVVSTEKNAYKEECYHPNFRLSAAAMRANYGLPRTDEASPGVIFHGRVIVSWAIFAAPRHPVIFRALENMQEMLKYEYLRQSVLGLPRNSAQWMQCMCLTGPTAFTASAREFLLHFFRHDEKERERAMSDPSVLAMTVHKRDFMAFGGVFKVRDPVYHGKTHYMHTMQTEKIPILHTYIDSVPNNNTSTDDGEKEKEKEPLAVALEDELVSIDGRELFLVLRGERRSFLDWDAFLALRMKSRSRTMHRLSAEEMASIPLSSLPPLRAEDGESLHAYRVERHAAQRQREQEKEMRKHWPANWPSLEHSFLRDWPGRFTTYNVSLPHNSASINTMT